MNKFLTSAAGIAAAVALAGQAQAATLLGVFGPADGYPGGNPCTGGFSDCFATQTGTNVVGGARPSSSVIKFNGNQEDEEAGLDPLELDEISTNYGTIDGSEFQLDFLPGNIIDFTYNPGAGDPSLHYFAIKQGRAYALFYDAAPILSGTIDLDDLDLVGSDFSHITFFNSRVPLVPEPGAWAMLILGFGVLGGALRSARKRAPTLRFG